MKHLLAPLFFLSSAGFASNAIAKEAIADDPLPTAREIAAHVRAHWSENYGVRFAGFASHPGELPELLEVTEVSCSYYFGIPDCTFQVTARFQNEVEQRRELSDNFRRDAEGRLQSVIVMVHVSRAGPLLDLPTIELPPSGLPAD